MKHFPFLTVTAALVAVLFVALSHRAPAAGADVATGNIFFPILRDLESGMVQLPPGHNDSVLFTVPPGHSFVLVKVWSGLADPAPFGADFSATISLRRAGTTEIIRLTQLVWFASQNSGRTEFELNFKLEAGDELLAQTSVNWTGVNTLGWTGVTVRP